ncbi:MAG: hypothetical protein ACKO1R_03370, partial [Crocinitomicaceae bacterium]
MKNLIVSWFILIIGIMVSFMASHSLKENLCWRLPFSLLFGLSKIIKIRLHMTTKKVFNLID